jgi:hypothetical protein
VRRAAPACLAAALLLTLASSAAHAAAADAERASNTLARAMLEQLIAINTTDTPRGNVTTAAEAPRSIRRTSSFTVICEP